jgi:hypothetical protein
VIGVLGARVTEGDTLESLKSPSLIITKTSEPEARLKTLEHHPYGETFESLVGIKRTEEEGALGARLRSIPRARNGDRLHYTKSRK